MSVSCWRHGREADLVVWAERFTLVIEVKVDAEEQRYQCEDLYWNFQDERNPHYLFLTPDGRNPKSVSTEEATQAFSTLAWSDVRRIVRDAYDRSVRRSDTSAVGAVVSNWLITLEGQFG